MITYIEHNDVGDVDASQGPVTIWIPFGSGVYVRKIDASPNPVTIVECSEGTTKRITERSNKEPYQ